MGLQMRGVVWGEVKVPFSQCLLECETTKNKSNLMFKSSTVLAPASKVIKTNLLNVLFIFCRRNFNTEQSKVNLLKVPVRSPPRSAASDYIRSPEPQIIQPRYISDFSFMFYCCCSLCILSGFFRYGFDKLFNFNFVDL